MSQLYVNSFSISVSGPDDPLNRDSYYANDAQGRYIVSDGVGKKRGSALTSRFLVNTLAGSPDGAAIYETRAQLQKAMKDAARLLHAASTKDDRMRNTQATLTMLSITGNHFQTAHVGDSRCYLFRDNLLQQLTEDHSLAFQQFKAGTIRKEDIRMHPNQKQLIRCFSTSNDFVIPEYHEGEIFAGDMFLLCSDGLSKEVTDEEIADFLRDRANLSTSPEHLVQEVQKRGGNDDVTILVVSVWNVTVWSFGRLVNG